MINFGKTALHFAAETSNVVATTHQVEIVAKSYVFHIHGFSLLHCYSIMAVKFVQIRSERRERDVDEWKKKSGWNTQAHIIT